MPTLVGERQRRRSAAAGAAAAGAQLRKKTDLGPASFAVYHEVLHQLRRGAALAESVLAMSAAAAADAFAAATAHWLRASSWVALGEKAMQRDKRERYASMAALADDLRDYLEGRVVQAYETGAVAELKKWVRRNRGLANALMAGVLVLLGGVVVSTYFWRDASQQALNVLRLGDARDLKGLWEESRELWPANEETAPEMELWIERAEELLARLPEHRLVYEQLSAEALPRTASRWRAWTSP